MSTDLLTDAPSSAPSAPPPRRGATPPGRRDAVRGYARPTVVAAVHLLSFAVIIVASRVEFLRNSIRLDEAQSLSQTNRSYAALLEIVAQDVHVPLYHVVLRTWRLVLGPDIETARLLSLVFLLACVPMFYLVARKFLSTRWSLFAVVVFSSSPFMLWYGNEARMYTMLVLVTLVSQYFFLTIVTAERTTAWVGYAIAAVVGVYTHYFFVFVLIVQGLFLLASARRRPRTAVYRLLGVALLVAAAFTPWFLYFRASGSASGTRPALLEPSTIDLSNVYAQFVFGFQSDAVNTILLSAWPLLVLAALASVRKGARLKPATAYLVAAAFGPVLLAFVVSILVTPFFLSRYMIASLPAFLLLAVAFLSGLSKPVARGLAAVLLAATVTGTVVQAVDPATPVQEDYRTAARLAEEARPQDLVVLSSPFTVYPFEYYYDGAARVTTLPAWDRQEVLPPFDPAQLPLDVESMAAGHQYIYLLLSYDQGYEEEIYQYFQQNFERTAAYEPSPGMRLLVYRVGYSDRLPVGDR